MNPILQLLEVLNSAEPHRILAELSRWEAVQQQLESQPWEARLELAQGLSDCLHMAAEATHAALEARSCLEEAAELYAELQQAVQGGECLLDGLV